MKMESFSALCSKIECKTKREERVLKLVDYALREKKDVKEMLIHLSLMDDEALTKYYNKISSLGGVVNIT